MYHGDDRWDAMSKSQLQHLLRSPAHFKAYRDFKRPPTPSQQKNFDIGHAVHTAVLEPNLLEEQVAAKPPGDGRTKKVRDAVAAAKAENPDIILLTEDEFRMMGDMSLAVHDHPTAGPFVRQSRREVSAYWNDQDTGLLCKGRADGWNEKAGLILDLKTCADARPDAIRKQVWNYGYYLQAAFYMRGFRTLGFDDVAYVILAIEKRAPYASVVFELDPLWISVAETVIDTLLDLYLACVEADTWPSYSGDVVELPMAEWQSAESEIIVASLDRTREMIRLGGAG